MEFSHSSEMHQSYPEHFPRIPKERLDRLREEETVKINCKGEGFWVKVKLVSGEICSGLVDNDLFKTDEHGLKCGDPVIFTKDNIYQIYENK